jgi:predicted double-glycine peptidase
VDTLIYQSQSKACGYACVKMALAHYGKSRNYANLKEPHIEDYAPSLQDLVDYAAGYGLLLAAYKTVAPSAIISNSTYPIMPVINEGGSSHMVYLKGSYGRSFLVFDPARGKRYIKKEDFAQTFTGVYLEATKAKVKRCYEKKPKILSPWIPLASVLFQLIASLSLFLGFFYINKDGDFLTPLLLFMAYGLTEIAERVFLVTMMKDFDRRYLGAFNRFPLGHREAAYTHYTAYKTATFSGAPSVFGGALEVAALAALLAVNDFYVGGCLIVLFLLLGLERVFLEPRLAMKKERLEALEQGFLGGPWVERSARPEAMAVVEEGYKIGNVLSFRNVVVLILDLALSLTCTLMSGHIQLNYFILCLMSFLFLGHEFSQLLAALAAKTDLDREEAYFIGHFLPLP